MERNVNEKRLRKIFKECFELMDKYKNGINNADEWRVIADLCFKKRQDEFEKKMYVACYDELARQDKGKLHG